MDVDKKNKDVNDGRGDAVENSVAQIRCAGELVKMMSQAG
jgi:hypothetical protein